MEPAHAVSNQPVRARKPIIAIWIRRLRRPKYLPMIRGVTHSCTHPPQPTLVHAVAIAETAAKPKNHGPLMPGWSVGRKGRAIANPAQQVICTQAAATATVL